MGDKRGIVVIWVVAALVALIAIGAVSYFVFSSDETKCNSWAIVYDGGGKDLAKDITIDSEGGVYVTGESYLENNLGIHTIKYNFKGKKIWENSFEGEFSELGSGIVIDDLNSVYVTGTSYYSDTGKNDHILKYNSEGNLLWDKLSFEKGVMSAGKKIARDFLGNIYIVGWIGDGISFGSHTDYYLIKYDSEGNLLWSKSFDDSSNDVLGDLGIDLLGNIYVLENPYYDSDSNTLIKYSSDGELIWSKEYSSLFAQAIFVENSGEFYLVGGTRKQQGYGSNRKYGSAISKYDAEGNLIWNQDQEPGVVIYDVDKNPGGDVYVTGTTYDYDYFFASYDDQGSLLWNSTYSPGAIAYGISVDEFSNIYVTGGTGDDYLTIKYCKDDQDMSLEESL